MLRDRSLSGDVLRFRLDEERQRAADPETLRRSGRSARTLLKEGPLRVALIVVAPGGGIREHSAAGPITVQSLDGTIRFHVAGEEHELAPGELISVAPGVVHSVTSETGGAFLLTVAQPETH